MGFFDNFIKQIDNGLKAVEDGKLEERLNQLANSIDKTSKTAEEKLKIAADKPSDALKSAIQQKDILEQKAKEVSEQVRKRIDIV